MCLLDFLVNFAIENMLCVFVSNTLINPIFQVVCRLVAALLHYFFLGTFCWMLLEGVMCYRMVVTVFNASLIPPLHLYAVGYGTPLVIVVISVISRPMGYGTERQ